MSLVEEYQEARRGEDLARLRRVLALRALIADGLSQRAIAEQLGVSQSAISQQLRSAPDLSRQDPVSLLEAGAPIVKALAADRGFTRLAVFGSVARGDARPDSDIDLLIEAPKGTSSFEFVRLQQLIEQVLGRQVDLVSYGGLKPGLDDDIRREAVSL
ncbi:MAG: Cro/Cl family transcriptional regulator [Actinomycetales bacterium mxb001]|nr:MAG: Cro/Cl family transcriptional regulator [Actinomycetales bacterium mxb001]